MRFFRFIFSRTFWVQLGLAVVVGIVGFVALNVALRSYTRHSERIAVPMVVGLDKGVAIAHLEAEGLRPVVMDSLYNPNGQPGAVVEQDPTAGTEVKGTRNVYLTVYQATPPSERLEVEEGVDAKVARILLEMKGFPFSERYEPAPELVGLVIRIENQKGEEIRPSDRIQKGEQLTLVIGKTSTIQVPLPKFVGMQRGEALSLLKSKGFVSGLSRWLFEPETANDSNLAVVSAQVPAHTPGREVLEGTVVDLTFESTTGSYLAPPEANE